MTENLPEPEGLINPLVARAKAGKLPESLGLFDITELLFGHLKMPGTFAGIFEGLNFTIYIHRQIERGLVQVEGYTDKDMPKYFFPDGAKEPIIHRDEISTCLELVELWPLDDGCLLSNWWSEPSILKATSFQTSDFKEQDKAIVQKIGQHLLKSHPKINTTHCKKSPDLKQFYEKYPGKNPVLPDQWLNEIGIPQKRGAPSRNDREIIPLIGNDDR